MHNATWVEIRAPEIDETDLRLDRPLSLPVADVARTFLVTPLATTLAHALCRRLEPVIGPVALAHPETIARGALRAGRLIERGLPHYFDRLEPISIAVLRHDEPHFEDLIPQDEVVPANREYVSPLLGGFVWGRGKTDAEFYVLKGGSEVRHWEVEKELAPPEDMPVTLRLRQTPGQSWARLSVTSHRWEPLERNPIDLDWEALTPQDLGPNDVLAKLRTPPPTIPDLLVEHAHLALWHGSDWAGVGAISHLERLGRPPTARDWSTLLRRARREPAKRGATGRERFWLVGTDGAVPDGLDPAWRDLLDQSLALFGDQLLAATLLRPPTNNEGALALTWSFRRCPDAVQERLVIALEAHVAGRPDPLLTPVRAIGVITQGAGRAVGGVDRLTRVLCALARRTPNNDTINALAMILTRREEAPAALSRNLVDGFLSTLGDQLQDQVLRQTFAVKFRNTLSAIAGLFRWRVREPYALLADREPVADSLRDTLARAETLLRSPAYRTVRQIDQKIVQVAKIAEYLAGKGDPDILRFIEAGENDDDDE